MRAQSTLAAVPPKEGNPHAFWQVATCRHADSKSPRASTRGLRVGRCWPLTNDDLGYLHACRGRSAEDDRQSIMFGRSDRLNTGSPTLIIIPRSARPPNQSQQTRYLGGQTGTTMSQVVTAPGFLFRVRVHTLPAPDPYHEREAH